jgi:hypothetical protein
MHINAISFLIHDRNRFIQRGDSNGAIARFIIFAKFGLAIPKPSRFAKASYLSSLAKAIYSLSDTNMFSPSILVDPNQVAFRPLGSTPFIMNPPSSSYFQLFAPIWGPDWRFRWGNREEWLSITKTIANQNKMKKEWVNLQKESLPPYPSAIRAHLLGLQVPYSNAWLNPEIRHQDGGYQDQIFRLLLRLLLRM